jgi:hypothetical protein
MKRLLPRRVLFAMARRRFQKRLQALFGRGVGGFAHGRFKLEARTHFLLDMVPEGDACDLLTGFSQVILDRYLSPAPTVTHTRCLARKDELCSWGVRDQRG